MCRRKKEKTPFKLADISNSKRKKYLKVNWDSIYDKAIAELGLQQTKRDQLITIYIALYAFLIPAMLETEKISLRVQGGILLACAILGILFGVIIIRYRIYKEVYWLCCQSITTLMGYKEQEINKDLIQFVFHGTIDKKGKDFIKVTEKGKKKGKKKFRKWYYVYKNLVSSETFYFLIHILITAGVFGLSIWMISDIQGIWRILLGAGTGIFLALFLLYRYFYRCIKVYWVLVDGTDESFNDTFKKAWFLHFYV